ncbi:MAG: glycosyltransferase [Patescibacteria group bacterium]
MDSGKKKLKILFIITKSNFGGAQRYVFDLATKLPKDSFEPMVALGGKGYLKNKLESAGVPTFSISGLERDVRVLKEIKAFFNIYKIIKETQPDIVHLNSSKAGALGAVAAHLYNLSLKLSAFNFQLSTCKVLFTAHGWAFKEKRKPFTKKIIEYLSWVTIFLSHRTIVVSNDDREKVKEFIFVQEKISVIHNGIEKPVFKSRDEARKIINQKIGKQLDDKKIWIGTIAELHKNKGLDHAINACSLLIRPNNFENVTPDKIVYVIIGGGEEKNNLELLIKQEKLEDIVSLAGEYPGAAELLQAFDVFLLPSLKEGLPYVALEAGQASLPTIATNVGGIPEIIEDMKSGILIKEKRPKEIAHALSYLIAHPEKNKEFGENLKKTVETKFTLEKMVEETITLYKTLS